MWSSLLPFALNLSSTNQPTNQPTTAPPTPPARALGARCPRLESLEVYFDRYSLPSELFTDEGLIALSEGCRLLKSLVLVNCDYVSDRSLYAVAANCRGLQELQLGGYRWVAPGGVRFRGGGVGWLGLVGVGVCGAEEELVWL